jgi:hypothetical protein
MTILIQSNFPTKTKQNNKTFPQPYNPTALFHSSKPMKNERMNEKKWWNDEKDTKAEKNM